VFLANSLFGAVASAVRAVRAVRAVFASGARASATSIIAVTDWSLAPDPETARATDGTPHLCGTGRAPSDEYG